MLSAEARQQRAAYMRQWRKRNPDKDKAAKERYWEKRAKQVQAEEQKNK